MDLMRAENALLRRGLPPAPPEVTRRKLELSEEYADLAKAVLARHASEIAGDHSLRHHLREVSCELDALTRENMDRLKAAMAATRRRIDSVMAAIRRRANEDRSYTGNGASVIGRMICSRADYKA
jgi:hypothetical protein